MTLDNDPTILYTNAAGTYAWCSIKGSSFTVQTTRNNATTTSHYRTVTSSGKSLAGTIYRDDNLKGNINSSNAEKGGSTLLTAYSYTSDHATGGITDNNGNPITSGTSTRTNNGAGYSIALTKLSTSGVVNTPNNSIVDCTEKARGGLEYFATGFDGAGVALFFIPGMQGAGVIASGIGLAIGLGIALGC